MADTLYTVLRDIKSNKDTYLVPENLKKNITALGVTGTVEELVEQTKEVTPTTTEQAITPDSGYTGLTQVTVSAVDNTIDENIVAENIKEGVTILGITGTVVEATEETIATAVEEANIETLGKEY